MRAATFPLPVNALEPYGQQRTALGDLSGPPQRPLPRLQRTERKGPVLHPSPTAADPQILSLNLANGCVHRCAFCSVRASASYPGDDVVYLYANTAERLTSELATRRQRPRAVYVSPSTDPFPPLAEFQAETARVVETLADHEIETWLMTRGYIRPAALRTLEKHRNRVKVTVGLTTLHRPLQRVLEPLAAPPRLRLRQIARLRALSIPVQVAVEPLVPGLTDTRANLLALLEALAQVGVEHVTTGYLFLRPGIRDNLVQALQAYGWEEMVLESFAGGPLLKVGAIATAVYLPKARRQRGYASLMAMAADLGITVSVSGVTNPDFQNPRRPLDAEARQLPRLADFQRLVESSLFSHHS